MKFNYNKLFFIQSLIYGFCLKSQSKIKKLNLLSIRLINLALLGSIIYEIVALFPEAKNIELVYGYAIDTTVCLIIYLNLIFNYDKISEIYGLLIEFGDNKMNCRAMKIGKVLSSLWLIALTIGTLCDFIGNIYLQKIGYVKGEISYKSLISLFLNLFNYYYLTIGVSVYAILNYTFINLLIYWKFENSIKSLIPNFNENYPFQNDLRFNLFQINKMLTCYQEIRKQINESMGIFPFLTISGIFMNICLRVTLFVTVDNKTIYLFVNSADFIILAFFNLLMVIILSLIPNENNFFSELISSLKKKTKSIISFCSFDKMQNNLFIEKTILFKSIYCPYYAQHNAWEMFCINKGFILSFVAAVTTFSVMLIQIKQSIK